MEEFNHLEGQRVKVEVIQFLEYVWDSFLARVLDSLRDMAIQIFCS